MKPQVGDYLEVEIDAGNVTNSPWTGEILKIEDGGYRVAYDDGDTLYEIPDKFIVRHYERNGKRFFVVDRPTVSQESYPASLRW